MLKWLLPIVLLCGIFQGGVAQKRSRLQHISVEEGLSQNTVNTIFQDSRGYMWFGTQNGLNRYDASNFLVFKHSPEDSTSIASSDIYAMHEDRRGTLWIGTRAGLSKYNRDLDRFLNLEDDAQNEFAMRPVWCMAGAATDDDLWLGASGGLFQFNTVTQKFRHFKINDSLQNANSIRAICRDRSGKLWVCPTIGKVRVFDKATSSFMDVNAAVAHHMHDVTSIMEDSEGFIWMAREDGSLLKYNPGEGTLQELNALKGKYPIRVITEDHEGRIWIGTDKGGVFLLNQDSNCFIGLPDKQENGTNVVLSFFNDAKGDMWLGTYHGGAYLFDKIDTTFNHFSPYPEVKHANESNSVLAVFTEGKEVWLGTDGGGLVRRRDGLVTYFRNEPGKNSLAGNTVLSISKDKAGLLYLGTYADGLSVFDRTTNKFTTYNQTNGLNDNSVWTVFHDGDHVWIGTNRGGLNLFNKKTKRFRYFTNTLKDKSSISSNTIRCIYKDSRSKLWVGTVSGLNVLNEKDSTFSSFFHREGNTISDANVLCIYEDSRRNVWFGTHGGGINRYNYRTNEFERWQEKDGLAGNIVYGILEDGQGNLWVSTDKGISKFDIERKEFKNFDTKSGLESSQFNTGAYFKQSDGRMYFGNIEGVTFFYPHNIRQNAFVPPIVFTDFYLFNKPVSVGENSPLTAAIDETHEIVLDHSQSVFSIRFAALNFTHADKNQFEYQLEPFDKEWIRTNNTHTATYTNLDPGTYTFKVKGSNNDGVWNETFRTLTIVIRPPYWSTWWFRMLVVGMLAMALYVAYRRKISQIKKQKELLASLVAVRTAEIEEKNNLLLETEKQNAQLMNQKLNDELSSRSKELTNYTLLIIQKNRLLDELKGKLKEFIRHPGSSNLRDFRQLVQMISLNFSSEKEWRDFDENFNRLHEGFSDKLRTRFPDLTGNDIKLCTLYRIGIPTRDIAEAMGISQTSVKMARYRLRKKLQLLPDEDIQVFLQNIE
ncbi:two-component regulator propeller domain-containing protein [Chryseolinea lacunae]|uniref:HTH luxR-type domain-containing protein n=1 Tax=Chryseolinea lacunae TaxID=2801331 RepID=A0ABS1KYS7_9BACT|nr:two-component regulator propeller domain-containing protein [Chryseolinea lacunae]MBL0744428.1 hypothetical protein [Chryseolinea lacunae]